MLSAGLLVLKPTRPSCFNTWDLHVLVVPAHTVKLPKTVETGDLWAEDLSDPWWIPRLERTGGNLWIPVEEEPRGSKQRTTSPLLIPQRTRTPLKIISVCVCFPLWRRWQPLDCVAAELLGSVQAGGRGGASPNQQQYKSPSFHSSVKSNEFNAHSQISLFSTQALNGSGDEAQIWCIRTQCRGIQEILTAKDNKFNN